MTTDKTLAALLIIRDRKPATAEDFARLLWPDSVMHLRNYAAGAKGSRRGCGPLTGGSFLSKLQKRGLVTKHFAWADPASRCEYGVASLTNMGQEYIDSHSPAEQVSPARVGL